MLAMRHANFTALAKVLLFVHQVPIYNNITCSRVVQLTALRHHITYPLSGVVQHLLPGRIKVPLVFLQQPLFGQGDGLFGSPEHLSGSLEVLCCPLGLKLSLGNRHRAA